MLQVKVNANMKKHNLIAKIFKNDPEMNEIFDYRSNEFKQQSNKLQRQKNKLKRTGFTDEKIANFNSRNEDEQFSKYDDKVTKCRKVIQKHQQYTKNPCN